MLVKENSMLLNTESFAPSQTPNHSKSKTTIWTARILCTLLFLFLLLDAAMKILKATAAVEGSAQLGYTASMVPGIGWVLLICTLLYLIPRTAVLGAILLTGYLGGAVATQVRVGNPLFTHVLFPVYFGALVWGTLYLRDDRLRNLISRNPRRG